MRRHTVPDAWVETRDRSRDHLYPKGWFDEPLAVVTRSYIKIHHRILDDPILDDVAALVTWMRGLLAQLQAKRRRTRRWVPDAVWLPILDAYGHRCVYCGADDVPLEKDHRIAVTRGGSDDPSNLVPACKPCNVRKYNHDPEGWPILFGPVARG